MKTARMPGTNLHPSVLALGTVPAGSTLGQAGSFALMDTSLETGATFIHAARASSAWVW